jgi:hypothetical protein
MGVSGLSTITVTGICRTAVLMKTTSKSTGPIALAYIFTILKGLPFIVTI